MIKCEKELGITSWSTRICLTRSLTSMPPDLDEAFGPKWSVGWHHFTLEISPSPTTIPYSLLTGCLPRQTGVPNVLSQHTTYPMWGMYHLLPPPTARRCTNPGVWEVGWSAPRIGFTTSKTKLEKNTYMSDNQKAPLTFFLCSSLNSCPSSSHIVCPKFLHRSTFLHSSVHTGVLVLPEKNTDLSLSLSLSLSISLF